MVKKTAKRMPRRREEFTYRGFSMDELKQMGMTDLVAIMPARARRKFLRGLTRDEESLLADIRAGEAKVRTHLRSMVIMPEMIGRSIEIHNGKEFVRVDLQPESLFHYLGEFALTRKRVSHGSAGIGATRSSKYVPLK
ncbi:MAG: 30S ribosomal protein S19 [Methanomicrobiales archaeon]|nr:30S ribosomal protein S19 [Methanomicrobiales archaeon]MDI6875952.1 30S ribosomal protein S19 [Methanomicrobiales archaeon]